MRPSRLCQVLNAFLIALPFGVENANGQPTDRFRAGGDMFWQSFLPPGRSVIFSVPRAALSRGRRVFVDFAIAGEQPERTYRVYKQAEGR